MNREQLAGSLDSYLHQLKEQELSESTIKKYERDLYGFFRWIPHGTPLTKRDMVSYRRELVERYRAATVNSYLISVNRYLRWLGLEQLTVKTLRIQRRPGLENVLSLEEYGALLRYCQGQGNQRNYLLLRVLAGTGIRVGELRFITYQACLRGYTEIYHKGRCRTVFIPGDIARLLCHYCEGCGIQGVVFTGRDPFQALQPASVWKLLKRLACRAEIDLDKAYPHSMRHLFAKTYMQKVGNLFELADLLGHASIETTRIYALTTHAEKRESVNTLEL